MVGAGLQRDVSGRAADAVAPGLGVAQGHDLSVRATDFLRVALPEKLAVAHDDAADRGVRGRDGQGQFSLQEGVVQPEIVVQGKCRGLMRKICSAEALVVRHQFYHEGRSHGLAAAHTWTHGRAR